MVPTRKSFQPFKLHTYNVIAIHLIELQLFPLLLIFPFKSMHYEEDTVSFLSLQGQIEKN